VIQCPLNCVSMRMLPRFRWFELALEQAVCFNCDNVIRDEEYVLLRVSIMDISKQMYCDLDSLDSCYKICCLLSTCNHVI
jgi:hypothetical protein